MGSGLDGWINRLMFVFIMLCAVCPIHVQIVLSHSAQDSTDMGVYECFVARQFRTTMDIACPSYLDFIHGGLHMQLVHHLFPRLPRPNLRRATVIVKKWAKENNIEFLEKDFTAGRGQMLTMLEEIAGQARAFNAKVAELASGECEMEI
ncbi:hypothetical protein BCR35DRAFT_336393 [Leucosporidium creatinivorum]|uniref:Fatty acid desaturase domain-containing protein n=1 Tax=Leucosporidium creatinivorum TaxID=106004 RepID=A0A1Y2C5X7_9BASI|nr:hypothetical protein BCR35DRAFT_336393 [Leucosporidium creatinivorum]